MRKRKQPSPEEPEELAWKDVTRFFYVADSKPKMKGCAKIAAFDMDHTILFPKSGAKFPNGRKDWQWWNSLVPEKLKSLHEEGYKVVIFTNQGGIEKNKQNKSDITGKISDVAKELGIPIQAFVAGAEDNYRKPFTAMWDYMVEHLNDGVEIDMEASFYCGDAAGRPAGWKAGAKKDFNVTDRKFAFNIGIKFLTPEELFLEQKPVKFEWRSVDPASILEDYKGNKREKSYHKEEQEMVIMVGLPASGKSTFSEKYFVPHGYVRINKDTLGTAAKCNALTKEALREGQSVVIDNTNGSLANRKEAIAIAQTYKVPVRCFIMNTPREVAAHLNYVRVAETKGGTRRIPDVAYNVYNKNFSAPQKSEGIDEIITIDFFPDLKGDEEYAKIFKRFTP
eukprot:TRINITY_DN1186_c0_g1_i2.p1 TRINITY_DN1186_c0_g1~~TRINITY_DN1186_c0_g1_i2.p1  ORF type:complete len:394 (-),score=106.18 TRINITY_DN1186_c0_g1_i2:55-1236(-)